MSKRPLSITALGWLFIVVGAGSLIHHLAEFKAHPQAESALPLIVLVQSLALLGGVFLLFGQNWARWLLATWMAFHVVISASHALHPLLVHLVLFGIIGYFLFRPAASAYFRGTRPEPPPPPSQDPPDLAG